MILTSTVKRRKHKIGFAQFLETLNNLFGIFESAGNAAQHWKLQC